MALAASAVSAASSGAIWPSGSPTTSTPLAGSEVSPVSVTVPTSDVIETSLSVTSGEPFDGDEHQLDVAAGLHVVGRLRGAQVDVAQRQSSPTVALVPLTAASWVAVWDDLPGAAAAQCDGAGQPAGRQADRGRDGGGTSARFEAVHPGLLLGRRGDRAVGRGDSTMHSSRWRWAAVAEG